MKRNALLAAFFILALAAGLCHCARADIAFVSDEPANVAGGRAYDEQNIYIVNPAGGQPVKITDRATEPWEVERYLNRRPAVSADARRIAYVGYRTFKDPALEETRDWNGTPWTRSLGKPMTEELYYYGYAYYASRWYAKAMQNFNWNIYIYDSRTGKTKKVTLFHWKEGDIQFIGNGRTLLYSLIAEKSTFIMHTASNRRGWKQIIYEDNQVINPSVSPDGRHMVYQSYKDGNWEIYLLKMAESYKDRLETRLTYTTARSELFPQWMGNSTIVFAANARAGTKYDIFSIDLAPLMDKMLGYDAHKLPEKQLTKKGGADGDMQWSAAAKKLAYVDASQRGGGQIFVLDPATNDPPKQLTTGQSKNRFPAWSPDGSQIAFISNADGEPGLYTMKADGSGQKRIGNIKAAWDAPVWY
jgi:TolB protein